MATWATATTQARVKPLQPRRAQPRRRLRLPRARPRRRLRLPRPRRRRAQPRRRLRLLHAYRMAAPPAPRAVSAVAETARVAPALLLVFRRLLLPATPTLPLTPRAAWAVSQ